LGKIDEEERPVTSVEADIGAGIGQEPERVSRRVMRYVVLASDDESSSFDDTASDSSFFEHYPEFRHWVGE
jgi:hypothetical protein